MRKYILRISLAVALLACAAPASPQLNKAYFFYMGRSFIIEDQYEAAIETLNILLRADPKTHEAYFLRGVAKYNLDDLLGAEADFTRAIENNPVYTMAYTYRAITRSRLGNYDDSLRDFAEAIALRPDMAGPYYSRGITFLLSQQFEKAIEDFDQFIKFENKVADAYTNRGTCYLYLKDTVRAMENYELAIRTNREDPNGYSRRGYVHLARREYDKALADLDMAIRCDPEHISSLFNRALVHSYEERPMESIADFDRVIAIDSTNSLTYFNRAIVRSHIGDYNRALDDYNKVALYSPNNVLVYYNRALLYTQLGNYEAAVADYSKAIELYPDFANAYLNRSSLRYMLRDMRGARTDRATAERKIVEYRSKVTDSTFSVYADTSRQFNQLLAFDTRMSGERFGRVSGSRQENVVMMPMYRFSLTMPTGQESRRHDMAGVSGFVREVGEPRLVLTSAESDIPVDTLLAMDRSLDESIRSGGVQWQDLFLRAVTQTLVKQYTNAVNTYSLAIEGNPTNAMLYLNRSATRSEMVDFISSIDDSYQKITVESDPASRLKNRSTRTYNYDEAIADLNKAAKLMPDCAYIYYNRANLYAKSGLLPEAYDDYTVAIGLDPDFAEAYFNRGLVQIYLEDTRKGCLDISKAGELGIMEAYTVLKYYSYAED